MRPTIWLPAAALLAGAAQAQSTPRSAPRAEIERDIVIERMDRDDRRDSTRAWLGLATRMSGRRDTLGLLVEDVVPGSPAAKAGVEEGNRLTSINGTSLKLSSTDADEPAMAGVVQRRLVRVLGELKPGAEVELGVVADGKPRTLRVKTIAASEAPRVGAMGTTFRGPEPRAVLGVSLGGQPSKRDTAGVFVSGVSPDGPAEKAGVVEGDRVAAINGVDLRVAREDAGDPAAARAKASRLERALRDAKPGDDVELRVVTAGRSRTVKVKTVEARELAERDLRNGEGFMFMGPMGGEGRVWMRPPMPPSPPMPPEGPGEMRWFRNGPDADVRIRINGEEMDPRAFIRERMPEVLRQFQFERGPQGRIEVRRERRITI